MNQSVSILIATRNRADSLAATLSSMAVLYLPENIDIELIVIDNGSTDHTGDTISRAKVKFPIRSRRVENPGKSRCMNIAASMAMGSVLLMTDDDVRPDAHWIDHMTRPLLDGLADAAQGGIRLAPYLKSAGLTPLQRAWIAERDISETIITKTGSLTGANMAITRAAFHQLGGFDENLGPGALGLSEESLLALALNDAGYRTIYIHDAQVEHHCSPERGTRAGLLQSAKQIGCSLGYIYHHWLQLKARAPGLRALKHQAQLYIQRVIHPTESNGNIPTDWEMNLVRDVWLWKQYAIESSLPAKYANRRSVPGS